MTIFKDDADRHAYLDLLGWVARSWDWDCCGYCLMGNHVHLLVRTREPTLGRGMHRLQSLYAQNFNARHARSGHLFQGRYGSSRIRTPERFRRILDYIAQNPVEARLCDLADEWPWSDAGARASGAAPQWLARSHILAGIQAELAAVS